MRILFITNLFPPYELGGMEQLCQEIVDALRVRGHRCHVLTSRYGVIGAKQPEDSVDRLLYLETGIHHYRPLDFFLCRYKQDRANHDILHRTIETFEPDIVFIWGMWNLSTKIACLSEQWMPGKVAYNIASYWPIDPDPHIQYWSDPGRRPWAKILLRPVALLAKRLLTIEKHPPNPSFENVSTCSEYVLERLKEAGIVPRNGAVILNGIDPTPFDELSCDKPMVDGALRLLYFGGLMPHKGVHTAIQALGYLDAWGQCNSVRLTIIGSGQPDYEAYLRRLTDELKLSDRVTFVGRVERSAIPEFLARHDVFVFTSIWPEPFGRTIIEAMAAGLAVVGTDMGGSREIFQHYHQGMLFPAGDPRALADRIQCIQMQPELLNELRHSGRNLVRTHFTLERMVNEVESWLGMIAE